MSEILIKAKGLRKQYGDFTAVNGINFSVKKGESFGFLAKPFSLKQLVETVKDAFS